MNDLILYWILPSLATLALILIRITTNMDEEELNYFDIYDFICFIIISILYPCGLVLLLYDIFDNEEKIIP